MVTGLKRKGLLVLFVSHRLEEVFEITDRMTVLRTGRKVVAGETAALSRSDLVVQMVGHAVQDRPVSAAVAADAGGIAITVRRTRGEPVQVKLQRGEIVGLGG